MILRTNCGNLRGQRKGNLICFEGIPYAKALRFRPPEPICWEGIWDCTSFGKQAPQGCALSLESCAKRDTSFGEDCLNLNIYTPSLEHNLPVVVYIHGGAFQGGSNRQRRPEVMIRGNSFIYVSINYRLGVLGYLFLGRLLGPEFQSSGNLGTLDQLAALRWIHENIQFFGGDPHRVTVMGESAGAKSIASLLLIPAMQQYCNQVCLASGALQSIRSQETAHQVARRFLKTLKEETPQHLLTAPVWELIAAQEKMCAGPDGICIFGPVADGKVLPDHCSPHIPLSWQGRAIVGSCRHEVAYYRMIYPDFCSHAPTLARHLFGCNASDAQDAFDQLAVLHNAQNNIPLQEKLWVQVLSDFMYRCHSQRLAFLLAQNNSQVWYYSMEFGTAEHCSDQNLAFNQLPDELDSNTERRLAQLIYQSYLHFFLQESSDNISKNFWPDFRLDAPWQMQWNRSSLCKLTSSDDVLENFPSFVYRLEETTKDN